MKCDFCGVESDFEAAFIKQWRGFSKDDRILCPNCWHRRDHKHAGWRQIAFFAAGIVGYILLWQNVWPDLGKLLTTLFLLNLFFILSTFAHELGHAIMGRLLGWRVFAVVVGRGKRVFKFEFANTIFSFHWLPLSGITSFSPIEIRYDRIKYFLIILAGPAVNAAIVLIILLISQWNGGLPYPVRLFLIVNVLELIGNLAPYHKKTSNVGSDGKQLIGILFNKQKQARELLAPRYAAEAIVRREEYDDLDGALEWCNKGLALFPDNSHLLYISGLLCLDTKNYIRAREIHLQLLSTETKPEMRCTILNNIAYADALTDDPELLPEADAYSKEALDIAPWAAYIIGTRGTVLVALGELEEGIKLLKKSLEKDWMPRSMAENACHLVIAYARFGDIDKANKYLKLAQKLYPKSRLMARAEAELTGTAATPQLNTSVRNRI